MTPCVACEAECFENLFEKDAHQIWRCKNCGLIKIDPQPTDETLANIYGTKYYDAWGVQTGADRVFELKKGTFRKHVCPNLDLQPGARVLDCGAAYGALMEVARENGFEPYGIELAEEAAAEIGRKFGPDRVFSGPFEQAYFPGIQEGSFDAICMCDFLEHVRDPLAVLQKAASLLRKGGQIVVTTPDGGSPSCSWMGKGWPHYKVEHLHYFSQKNIAQVFQRAGFSTRHTGSASKVLDFQYIRHQFNTYPRAVVTPLINAIVSVGGEGFSKKARSFSFGELIAVGIKQ